MAYDKKRCYSGGAEGADLAWDDAASEAGYEIVHFSFEGHNTRADPAKLRSVSPAMLEHANEPLKVANYKLKRPPVKSGTYRGKLLQRNYYQVVSTQAVYAIVQQAFADGTCAGGTGWAVQMFVDIALREGLHEALLPIYVFDQTRVRWYQRTRAEPFWRQLDNPPKPPEQFTGIGTRKLNAAGKRAIRGVFG